MCNADDFISCTQFSKKTEEREDVRGLTGEVMFEACLSCNHPLSPCFTEDCDGSLWLLTYRRKAAAKKARGLIHFLIRHPVVLAQDQLQAKHYTKHFTSVFHIVYSIMYVHIINAMVNSLYVWI